MESRLDMNINEFLPLREEVFNTLRSAILTGQFRPGDRLMEVPLANQLGVSRTPVREAIHKLEQEGLVTIVPRRGAEVAKITEKSLQDVLEVRRALDVLSVELACERITQEELESLKKACQLFEKATHSGNTTAIAKADVAFHDIIVQSTGNQRLQQLVNNLAEQMYRYRFVYLRDDSQHVKLVEEHQEILDSILHRDKEKASEAARRHIDNQENSIIRQIRLENQSIAGGFT